MDVKCMQNLYVCNCHDNYFNFLVLVVLKKNYGRLHHCLPQDCGKTVEKLKQLIPEKSAISFDHLKTLPTTDAINEAILGSSMCLIQEDHDVFIFCEMMEALCDSDESKYTIETLRNGITNIICINILNQVP